MEPEAPCQKLPVEAVPVALLLVDRERRIVLANRLAGTVFRCDHESLVGVTIDELVPARSRDEHRALIDRALRSLREARTMGSGDDLFALTRDGREVPVRIAMGPAGDDEHMVLLLRDISDEVAVRDELKRSEARFRMAAEVAADLIYDADVLNDDQGWCGDIDTFAGYPPGEFPRSISGAVSKVHPEDRPSLQAVIERAIKKGFGYRASYRLLRKDGSYMHVEESVRAVDIVNGQAARAVGVLTDVTDRMLAQQELERTLAELTRLKDKLQAESEYLQTEIKSEFHFDEIVGTSPALTATLRKIEAVAATDSTVLLLGETGTGKELIARALHARSGRSRRALIKVDCSNLPEGLIESELFGHVKGAFTGAHETTVGRFELAHEGTIFLDEIGELPLDLQSKLLRVLETGEIQRIGSRTERTVDVRVIAATNRDLEDELREGRFRSDLFYRLGVFPVESPPLRSRREDIPALASFFVTKLSTAMRKSIHAIDSASIERLEAYAWPGNVRELRNVIERAVILCPGDTLTIEENLGGTDSPAQHSTGRLDRDLHALQRSEILGALDESGWKIKGPGGAAERLGLKPSTLRSRMQRLGISRR